MANILLIWDKNEAYVQQLCFSLEISFHSDVVFSFADLKEKKFLSDKDAIVLLLETDIDDQKRTWFYGLEIIQYLRREVRFAGLIIAFSTFQLERLRKIRNSEILFTSGSRLIQLTPGGIDKNLIEKLVATVPKLSSELLDDIIFSTYDLKGRIHEHLHNLKNDLNIVNGKGLLTNIIQNATTIFNNYRALIVREIEDDKLAEFNSLFESLIKQTSIDITEHWESRTSTSHFNYTNSGTQVSKFSHQIVALAPYDGNQSDPTEEQIMWEVLFLDDKPDIRKIVHDFFQEKNVVCHLAANENEVYEILKTNSPKISLFLTDIRLIDSNDQWCDRQGYDVIEQAYRIYDCPLVYAVLTSKRGTISKMVQKKRKYEILWFSKEDVINNSHSFNIFFDIISKYAAENFNSSYIFQPSYGYWTKPYKGQFQFPLKVYYKYHREAKDYLIEENSINKRTLEWIDGGGTKQEWQTKLLNSEIDEIEIRKFRESKLLARRIVLGLCANGYQTTGISIYNRLKGVAEIDNDRVKGFFSVLALSPDVQKHITQARDYFNGEASSPGILYEEYDFLKSEYFEEYYLDIYSLGDEKNLFLKFILIIEDAFLELRISIPPLLHRMKSILEQNGSPNSDKLTSFAALLREVNETHNIYKKSHSIKRLPIADFRNERIQIFLQQAELVG